MVFLDPDEYLVPVGEFNSWKDILTKVDEKEKRKVLKFRSTRARARLSLLEPTFDPAYDQCPSREEVAENKTGVASCLVPRRNETFLKTYNCEYIKTPKPERFQRAMVSKDGAKDAIVFPIVSNVILFSNVYNLLFSLSRKETTLSPRFCSQSFCSLLYCYHRFGHAKRRNNR